MPSSHRTRRALWLLPAAAVAALDLWTKALWTYPSAWGLALHQKTIVEGWLYVRTTWNRGGVWSMDVPASVLLGATAAAVPLLLLWLFWPRRASAWESCGKALILGGAFGNLWDRVWHDAVRDFIDVCFGDAEGWHYPTFNVADVALVAGIALLFLASFRGRRTEAA